MNNNVELVNKTTELENPKTELQVMYEMAEELAMKGTIIPAQYQRNKSNCLIALDMANRMGVSPMFVMQNLYVVNGKPSWSGTAVASMINNCGKFSDVELIYVGEPNTDSWGAYVSATNKKTGKKIKGATVTIAIAKAEKWMDKAGSKWKTMPELMLSYRAYSWFGRQWCPELMMGLQTNDEIEDVSGQSKEVKNPYNG